jgi:hypothetical protein
MHCLIQFWLKFWNESFARLDELLSTWRRMENNHGEE